jgi:hypothetical protein
MPSKFDFLSPGIQITEVDDSVITPTPDEDGPIIIGRTRKGPAMKPVKVRNMADYISVFGTPNPGGNSETGDVWRDGAGSKAPTYASYAAQAWLASGEAPINVVRLLGVQHDAATGYAGWTLGTASSDAAQNRTAYGLFICSGSMNGNTGSLAAVIYADEGALTLSGTLAGTTSDLTSAAETFVKAGADLSFTVEAWTSANASSEKISVNFNRNSANYIRNVMNTDPTVTNSALYSSDAKTHWLGQTYLRSLEDTLGTTSFADGEFCGFLAALQVANQTTAEYNWGGHNYSMQAGKSGWVIGNDTGVASGYAATSATKMFRFEMLHEGSSMQDDILIAFEDLALPTNPIAYNYSTFTVRIMDTAGNTLEKYSNLVMDPTSPNYIFRIIGDMYQEWNSTDKRYRSHGDFPNNSNYIRVKKPGAGLPGDTTLLPFGFLGAGRPKGFVTLMGVNGVQPMHDDVDNTDVQAQAVVTLFDGGSAPEASAKIIITLSNGHTYTVNSLAGGGSDTETTWTEDSAGVYSADIDRTAGGGTVQWKDSLVTLFSAIPGFTGVSLSGTSARLIADAAGAAHTFSWGESGDGVGNIALGAVTAGDDEDNFTAAPIKVGGSVPNGSASGLYYKNGSTAYTASFVFPRIAMRAAGADGFVPNPYKAYFGINPKIGKDSTIHDRDYCDYLRIPAGNATLRGYVHDPSGDWEHSVAFSLDDIVVDASLDTVTWTDGSRAVGTSYTATNNVTDLLGKGVSRWIMPMFGGDDGLDVQEIDPFSAGKIDGTADHTNYVMNSLNRAIDCVADEEVVPANLLLMPGVYNSNITSKMIRVAEARQDVLAIIDLEDDYVPAERSANRTAVAPTVSGAITKLKNRNLNSSYACAFFPWVQAVDTLGNSEMVWLPSSVAGLGAMASSQASSDVWFAPAGFNRGGLSDLGGAGGPRVVQARTRLDSSERDDLYVQNINPIATFPNEGVVIFGQKTLQQTNSALDRINVRRLMLLLKRKISNVAKNVLFDNNVEATWNRFKSDASPILDEVQSRYGLTEYKLILDETTTTPDLIDRNILYAKVFLKPARAIEFIAIDFIISKTGAEFA